MRELAEREGMKNQMRSFAKLDLTRGEQYRNGRERMIFGSRKQDEVGAGDGNRTRVASLEDWNSTIELHPLPVARVY
jgi:hypothetical protein